MTQALYSNLGFKQLLEIREGSTFPIQLEFTNPDGTPFDLTGAEIKAKVARTKGGSDNYDFTFEVDDPLTGIAKGFLTPAQTAAMDAEDARMSVPRYAWACDIKLVDGTVVPFCHGDVFVRSSIINWS